jgi:serine phosphatase RsbU (regulator of sigma subunit)
MFAAICKKSCAQELDSLDQIIKANKEDTLTVNALNALSWEIMYEFPDSSITLGNQALHLSRQISFRAGEGKAQNNLGWFYSLKGNFPESMRRYSIALSIWDDLISRQVKPSSFLLIRKASTYGNIGLAYVDQADYAKALDYYFKALKTFEELNDKQKIATALGNIGQVYDEKGEYEVAIKYYNMAVAAVQQLTDKRSLGRHYGNLGVAYFRMGEKISDPIARRKNLEKSLEYYMLSRSIAKAQQNVREVARTSLNLSSSYQRLSEISNSSATKQELEKRSKESLEEAQQLSKDIGDKDMESSVHIIRAEQYISRKEYESAREPAVRALEIAHSSNARARIADAHRLLGKVDSAAGKGIEAYRHLRLYYTYRDSINNEEVEKQIVRSQMQYEFDKQQGEAAAAQQLKDAAADEERRVNRLITITIATGLLLTMALALLIYRGYRQKNKANEVILHQKNEIEARNKDITDSINYAQRIQKALLASGTVLDRHLGSWFVLFLPKDIVSGDFYWANKLEDGKFAVAIADSTGHGVPGAIMSMLNIACLNEAVTSKKLTGPAEILNYTRERIINYLAADGSLQGGNDGMDCVLFCLDFERKLLYYSSANNSSWIVRDSEIIELTADKMPVGRHSKQNTSFTEHCIELQSGDLVYTATDGYQDQFGGPKGKKYMQKRFRDQLQAISKLPIKEQQKALEAELGLWRGEHEQVDDICVLGIQVS